jgi:hypothetical protein
MTVTLDVEHLDQQHETLEAAHFGASKAAADFEASTGARSPELDEAARIGMEQHLAFHKAVSQAGLKLTPKPAS